MKPLLAVFIGALFLTGCTDHDLSVKTKPVLLTSATTYFKNPQGEYRPADRTIYTYDEKDKLVRKEYFTFDVTTNSFTAFSASDFTYSGNDLIHIEEFIGDNTSQVTSYEYAQGKASRIFVDSHVDTDATIQYLQDTIEILYTHSNGRWFTYRFTVVEKNKVLEQTFDDSNVLASEVIHEYDGGINPYSLLGYTDLFFTGFSGNNRVKTESHYYGIAFPQSVPVAYSYVYNDKNLPVEQITTYTSYPNGQNSMEVKTVFEYR